MAISLLREIFYPAEEIQQQRSIRYQGDLFLAMSVKARKSKMGLKVSIWTLFRMLQDHQQRK